MGDKPVELPGVLKIVDWGIARHAGTGRQPSMAEVAKWLPDKFWDVVAGYLSTIEWIPANAHPQSMQEELGKAIAAAIEVVSDESP